MAKVKDPKKTIVIRPRQLRELLEDGNVSIGGVKIEIPDEEDVREDELRFLEGARDAMEAYAESAFDLYEDDPDEETEEIDPDEETDEESEESDDTAD
jgi:hypothetical protein